MAISKTFVGIESSSSKTNPAGYSPCQGLYVTATGHQPKVAFIATHYNVDFSEHYLADYLAELGFGFLGWNTRFRGIEAYFLLEHALVDIAAGVQWLKQQAGVEKIVLLGNSGGGSLMAAYLSQANSPNVTPLEGMPAPPGLESLPGADFYISLNAHRGRPEVLTEWMDASVVDENDPLSIDQSLSMYNPDNGPAYSDDFIKRYRLAQQQRNHRITAWCEAELKRLQQAGVRDRVFTLQRVWADLRLLDGTIDPSARRLNRCYIGDPKQANFNAPGIGNCCSLKTWLSMWSLQYSQCSGVAHLPRISQPSLVIQSDADVGVFPSDGEFIFQQLGSLDKTLQSPAGDHYMEQPSGARQQVAHAIQTWLDARL